MPLLLRKDNVNWDPKAPNPNGHRRKYNTKENAWLIKRFISGTVVPTLTKDYNKEFSERQRTVDAILLHLRDLGYVNILKQELRRDGRVYADYEVTQKAIDANTELNEAKAAAAAAAAANSSIATKPVAPVAKPVVDVPGLPKSGGTKETCLAELYKKRNALVEEIKRLDAAITVVKEL